MRRHNGRVTTRIPSLISPPIGFAHRGGRAHAAENTLEAFGNAIEMGATGIETDARITADGEIVLVHDRRVRLKPRPRQPNLAILGRPVAKLRRDQLPGRVSALADYYRSFGAKLPLSVDVKDPAAFDGVVAVARAHGAAECLWACHEDLDLLSRWRRAAPDVRLVHSARLERQAEGPERHAADLARLGIDAVNMRHDSWSGGLVTLYHRFGVLAFGWDAQQERQIADLIDAGIDAVYSDHVDRLTQVTARFAEG